MAIVEYNNNPSITDTVRFTFLTPDGSGCLLSLPYKFDNVTLYFVERDFSNPKLNQYVENIYDPAKLALAKIGRALV